MTGPIRNPARPLSSLLRIRQDPKPAFTLSELRDGGPADPLPAEVWQTGRRRTPGSGRGKVGHYRDRLMVRAALLLWLPDHDHFEPFVFYIRPRLVSCDSRLIA